MSGRTVELHLPDETIAELHREAERQGRSLSWLAQRAWRLARAKVARFPGVYQDEEVQRWAS